MARGIYEFETSPRKLQPSYNPKKRIKKLPNKESGTNQNALKLEKRKHHKNIAIIIGLFLVLLTISYRNSLITERFNEIQSKKSQLAAIEKTNGQMEVSIESSLNLKNIEKAAKKKLGMQKVEKDQKVYISLPKKDYTESAVPEVEIEKETNWLKSILSNLFK